MKNAVVQLVVVVLIMSSLVSGQYSGGGGTQAAPYQIASAADLIALGENTGDYDQHFILTADIDLAGYEFSQAVIAPDTDNGDWNDFQGTVFNGVLDGNGHRILNLTINGSEQDYVGLIGNLGTDGQLRHIGLENEIVYCRSYCGGLCGFSSGAISHCYSNGLINGNYMVGGLLGYNSGGLVEASYAMSAVTVSSSYTGGLVGFGYGVITACYSNSIVTGTWNAGGIIGENRGLIEYTYALGSVSGNGRGGIAGNNMGEIKYSFCACQIYSEYQINNIGGLVGQNSYDGKIVSCFWDRDVARAALSDGGYGRSTTAMQSQGTYQGWGGGIWVIDEGNDYPHLSWENTTGTFINNVPGRSYSGSGTESDPYRLSTAQDIRNMSLRAEDWDKMFVLTSDIDLTALENYLPPCDFSGKLDGQGYTITNLSIQEATSYLGLIGCLSEGGILCGVRLDNVTISGYRYLGGLVGFSYKSYIDQCSVNGSIGSSYNQSSHIGGLIGYSFGGVVERCYSRGTVAGTTNATYVGGLVGYHYASCVMDHCYSFSDITVGANANYIGGLAGTNCGGDIYNSFSAGQVAAGPNTVNIGGLIGGNYNSNVVSNCYWDTETSGMAYSDGGFGRSTQDMKTASTYIGWEGGWTIDETQDYPHLFWENAGGIRIDTIPACSYPGSGTQADPYRLATAEDVYCMSCRPGDWNTHFTLMNSIDMSGIIRYQPPAGFGGTIEGNGYQIQNLIIQENTSYLGLIGYLSDSGELVNVHVADCLISGYRNTGGLAGLNHSGTIEGCSSTGQIAGMDQSENIGGLVGSNDYGVISKSYSACEIASGNDSRAIGGLVGYNVYHTIIDQCYTTGAIYCLSNTSWVGGLVGYSWYGDMHDCYSACGLQIGDNSGKAGGLIGSAGYETQIEYCYATGQILTGNHYSSVGGLIGDLYYNCSVNGSFWDMDSSGWSTSNGGTGLDTASMKAIETYLAAGWRFPGSSSDTPVWYMPDDDYPHFLWDIKVFVPDVVGMSQADARSALLAGGLDIAVTMVNSDTIPAGQVISQMPIAGTEVNGGSVVTLVVSRGMPVEIYVGDGTDSWNYPLSTYYHDARTQTIYRAEDIGGACVLVGLSLDITQLPGQAMNNFTIRMKHTDLNDYSSSAYWEAEGWTVVYQANETIESANWVDFVFQAPFVYNGVQNLMVDISFNNNYYTSDGLCRCSTLGGMRSLYYRTDSGYGDPLNWSGYSPSPMGSNFSPNLRLALGSGTMVTVPDITGLTQTEAESALLAAGLKIGRVTQGFSDLVESGLIISQMPAAGSMIPEGFGISIQISLGRHYSGGSGTADNPYRIATMADWVNLTWDSASWDKHFIVTADIDFGGAEITPVAFDSNSSSNGFQGTYFTGTLDGGGKVLSNFVINQPESDYVGLFGYIRWGGQVMDLGLHGIVTGRHYVGGLCGYNYGTLSRCFAGGTITGRNYLGGFCGWNGGSITHCYATGSVSGNYAIGGLCGYSAYGTIGQSYAAGSINSTGSSGGLCGSNRDSNVFDSYWNIETSGLFYSQGGWGLTDEQMKQAGSYYGWQDGVWTIVEGEAFPRLAWEHGSGDVIATDYPARTYGGYGSETDPFQIGSVDDLVSLSRRTDDWSASIVLMADIDLEGIPFSYPVIAGGGGQFNGVFTGNNHVISNLAISGEGQSCIGLISTIGYDGQVSHLGLEDLNIAGGDRVGGVCGINRGMVTQCYMTGAVAGNSSVGGLCGSNSGMINQCYTMGTITGQSGEIGGLCGDHDYGLITQCYSVSSVAGAEYSYNVGSLCGMYDGAGAENNYYLRSPGHTDDRAMGLTDTEMTCRESFSHWDFAGIVEDGTADVWAIEEGADSPRFAWQELAEQAVPDVLTLSPTEAATILQNNGYEPGSIRYYYSDTIPAGRIIYQSATAGHRVTRGRTIGLYVSRGRSPYGGGGGYQADPLRIDDLGDFLLLSYRPQDYDKYFVLTSDIDLTGMGDNPNGSFSSAVIGAVAGDLWDEGGDVEGAPFTGVLDGGGHTISGLVIEPVLLDDDYDEIEAVGLFGQIRGGRISHLRLQHCMIVYAGEDQCRCFGLLAGCLDNSRVTDVMVAGDIALATDDAEYIGGAAGRMLGSSLERVAMTGSVMVTGVDNGVIGGLIGCVGDGGYDSSKIVESYANTRLMITGGESIGGLIGVGGWGIEIADSFAWGRIEAGDSDMTGGFAGEFYGRLERCYAAVQLACDEEDGEVGGLLGYYEFGDDGYLADPSGVYRSYWDMVRSGLVLEDDDDNYANTRAALAPSRMRDRETYRLSGWDLDNESENGRADIWVMADGHYPTFTWQDTVMAPDVRGMSPQDAQGTLQAAGYVVGEVVDCYHDDMAPGQIAVQMPPAGSAMAVGQAVDLFRVIGRSPYSQGGGGYVGNPLKITSLDDLILLASRTQDHDQYIALMADIDLSEAGGNPDGSFAGPLLGASDLDSDGTPFSGALDGRGHSISGFRLNATGEEAMGVGLFGLVEGGRISHLKLCDSAIHYNNESGWCYYAGLLAGNLAHAMVDDVQVDGLVSIHSACDAVGGTAGWASDSLLDRIVMSGTVSVSGYSNDMGGIGGLVGYVERNSQLQRCLSRTNLDVISNWGVGGLVGKLGNSDYENYDSSRIDQCCADGIMTVNGCESCGGLAGSIYSTAQVTNSYARGQLEAIECYILGGLVGYQEVARIENCYASVTLLLGEGCDNIGGLVGYCEDDWYEEEWLNSRYGAFNSFWDAECSGLPLDGGDYEFCFLGAGLTTSEMQDIQTYLGVGWDFIGEEANGIDGAWRMPYLQPDYPMLAWQKDIPGDLSGEYGVDMADWDFLSADWLAGYDLADLSELVEYWLAGLR